MASPQPSLPATKAEKDALKATLKQHEPFRKLLYLRQLITNVEKTLKASGPLSIGISELSTLRRVLIAAEMHTFPEDPKDAYLHYAVSEIGRAVRHLVKPDLYGPDIAWKASKLVERWGKSEWTPGPVPSDEDFEFTSDEEGEESDGEEEEQVEMGALMRGIKITRNRAGGRTYSLDPAYPRREAAVFGHNGLTVGDWWPYQICALRDGGHGSRMGGIHGRVQGGAYSVVISGHTDYEDTDADQGNTVYYSGSRGSQEKRDRDEAPGIPVLTNATMSLMRSENTSKPVRLFRGARNSHWAPGVGIRYDGLYRVISHDVRTTEDGVGYYRFTMSRISGQPEIDRSRPSLAERKEFVRMTQNR